MGKIGRLLCLFSSVFFVVSRSALAVPDVDFTVSMSEAVNVSGCPSDCPRIELDVGGQLRYAEYVSGGGTSSLVFRYVPTVGDLDLDGVSLAPTVDLNGGAISDLNGNAVAGLGFAVPDTSGVKIDYPSLSMDFAHGASGRYTVNGSVYNDFSSFLAATGGTFTRNSEATYFDSTGVLQVAASNQPRFDHDPDSGTGRALLMEEQRTNLIRNSNNFTVGPWVSCVALPLESTTTAPDGSSAPVYSFSTTQCLYQDAAVAVGDKLTHSIWIKANKVANIGLRLPGISTFTNQTITVGTSWKRYSVNNQASHTSTRFLIDNRSSNGYGAVGLELSFFGAQAEKGGFATSYIPTAATTKTRGADALSFPIGAWHNQAQGTFYNDIAWQTANNLSYPMFFRLDDGTSNNRWNSFYYQETGEIRIGSFHAGVNQGSVGVNKPFSGGAKIASAQEAGGASAAFDGNVQSIAASWSPPSVTQLNIGSSGQANKRFFSLKYYPVRVPDAQLQRLTE